MLRSKNAPHPVQDTGLVFMGRLAGLYASVLWKNPTRLGYSSSPMDYNYLSYRVKALQKELGEIALHNRKYFNKSHHSDHERVQHKARIERVTEIRAELRTLMDQTAA
jgi:hypothetical protein